MAIQLSGTERILLSEQGAIERQKDMEAFWADLDSESDRGVVLATGCYFEELLRHSLHGYFSDHKESEELLRDGVGLGTFASRNKCCLALRITDREEYETLRLLARIRNKFAHRLRASFEDSAIADLTREMAKTLFEGNVPVWESIKTDRPRKQFTFTAFCLNDRLWLRPYDASLHVQGYPSSLPEHTHNLLEGASQ